MTQELIELVWLPLPSTDVEEVVLVDERGTVTIRYTTGSPSGDDPPGRLEPPGGGHFGFDRVRSYRRRAESHCGPAHLQAYDRLVEVTGSEWVEELRSAMPVELREAFEMHHFMIYFDSFGCYEVVAGSFAHGASPPPGPGAG